ncbi:hypothetical protein QQP08_004583 [Theobroma cacao]|nr:hypothetical protein QQP08_004583 [Theobroma cacao]
MASEALFVVVVVAAAAAVVLANALPVKSERGGVEKDEVNIWPMSAWVSHGRDHLYMSNDFVLSTEGSGYGDASGILKDAFHRMLAVIKLDHVGLDPTTKMGFKRKYGLISGILPMWQKGFMRIESDIVDFKKMMDVVILQQNLSSLF